MKRKKTAVRNFMRWLEWCTDIKFPKATIVWRYKAVASPTGGSGFGATVFIGDKDHLKDYIYVAGDWPKSIVMHTLAHEFAHHKQFVEGWAGSSEEAEEQAEAFAVLTVGMYYRNKRWRNRYADL